MRGFVLKYSRSFDFPEAIPPVSPIRQSFLMVASGYFFMILIIIYLVTVKFQYLKNIMNAILMKGGHLMKSRQSTLVQSKRFFSNQAKNTHQQPKKSSKQNINTSEFKTFFRLRLQDRPIKLASKIKETYKTNKAIRRTIYVGKYLFGKRQFFILICLVALSFLLFVFPGTFIPGQYYAKLLLIEARKRILALYSSMTQPQGSGQDFVTVIQHMSWKFQYLRKNVGNIFIQQQRFSPQGMLSPQILADDLHSLCKLIDELSLVNASEEGSANTVILECLSYINKDFLPTLLAHNIPYFQNVRLQTAVLDFLDIISLRFEKESQEKVAHLKLHDNEEFLYREGLLTQFVNLSLIMLKFTFQERHVTIYNLVEELVKKAGPEYDLAESFTTMEGIQTLLKDMNAEDPEDQKQMQLIPGQRSVPIQELRLKSLHMLRTLISMDDLVGVKLFKLKILSNLLTHTLREAKANFKSGKNQQVIEEIKLIADAFLKNQYRQQLIKHSQDFKEEKKRLENIVKNKKDFNFVDEDIRKTMGEALEIQEYNIATKKAAAK